MTKKTCPYCSESIDFSKANESPRTAKLRWYQFTPSPRTSCPKCGGYITQAMNKLTAFVFAMSWIIIFPSVYIFENSIFFKDIPGGSVVLLILIIPLAIWVRKRTILIKDKS